MAITTEQLVGTVQSIPLTEIRTDQNVRQALDPVEVDQVAQSIALLGQLTPASVRPDDGGGFVLIAGHKRYAALEQLGRAEIRAEVRAADGEAEASERAAENIVRSQLTPLEEAIAVKAMLDRGLTQGGAATALGWSKARVTARLRLLQLPEAAREMIGDGRIPLSSVDQLRAIGNVSPGLLDLVVAFLADGSEWAAERLAREPGWVLDSALRASDSKTFAEYLSTINSYRIAELRLGKKTDEALQRVAELHKKLNRDSYSSPSVRFSDEEIDQARAAGVVIEFDRSAPVIVDKSLYRELCKQAIKRTAGELEQRLADVEEERKAERQAARASGLPVDPAAEAQREEQRQLRELSEHAHGVNLDLGAGLLGGLSTVDPADLTVARFFVYSLLGADHDSSPYTQTGERVARLAASGIRLVIEEFRADVTKTLKSGEKGRMRIDYGDPRQPEDTIAWMWKFVDGAKTAGELYGRALVVIAAEQYASRLVVPTSQRTPATRWSSHKGLAEKALRKLAGPHLPASLKQLERAIAKTHAERETASKPAPRRQTTATATAAGAGTPAPDGADQVGEDLADETVTEDSDGDGE